MPLFLVLPYPYPRDPWVMWRIDDGLVRAENAAKAVEEKNFGGMLVQVVNLDEAEVYKSETTCNTVVTKVG